MEVEIEISITLHGTPLPMNTYASQLSLNNYLERQFEVGWSLQKSLHWACHKKLLKVLEIYLKDFLAIL